MRYRVALIPLLLALLVIACGSDDGADSSADKPATTATDGQATAPQATEPGECQEVDAPAPKPDGGQKKPTEKLEPGKTYEVEIQTNCGAFTIRLDQKASPATAASFVSLARKGFFDGTVFHRIVPGFVIQGGDPTGSGTGGPGYSTVDRPPADVAYTEGVVAMAKAPQEAPGTSGSQFYVVTGADAGLPPDYALLGRVSKGLDVVRAIGQLGDPATEQPLQAVVMQRAIVSER
ncbi:MAG: peptidylprolyl isomerase [Actinomycetota bacterium]|nr:peptidylprolyl isomerase [Actinomycetota bacterium]